MLNVLIITDILFQRLLSEAENIFEVKTLMEQNESFSETMKNQILGA